MMNRVVLVGRLTRDPELRYTPNGIATTTFILAVNRNFKNAAGEQEADFIQIVVWRKAAENAANYLKKGSLAGIDGRIQTRNYEGQDGKRVYVTEVVAESVQFLDPRNSQNTGNFERNNQEISNTSESKESSGNGRNNSYTRVNEDPFAGDSQIDILDDDLPF